MRILSDENAKRWVISSRQAEQCIYPHLTRIQQQHFSKEDEKSMGYATYLFKKYKITSVEPMKSTVCQQLRSKAKDDLAVVKGQYKSGMVEENKTSENKNKDGVATNENKFFFDIIKWGTALIL